MMPTQDRTDAYSTDARPLDAAVLRPSANIARIAGIAVVGVLIVLLMGYKLQRLGERVSPSSPATLTLPAEYTQAASRERAPRRVAAEPAVEVADGTEGEVLEETPEPAPEDEAR